MRERTYISYKCRLCEKEFLHTGNLKIKRKYCSTSCSRKSRCKLGIWFYKTPEERKKLEEESFKRRAKETVCIICNKSFLYKFRNDRNRKFCSVVCKKKHNNKIEISCKVCDKKFLTFPSNTNRSYCNKKCWSHGMQRGDSSFYKHATREEIRVKIKMLYLERVIFNDNECWGWVGTKDKDGYGKFQFGIRSIRAHRASWMIHNGNIPNKLLVLHKCDNPPCSNPEHLFLGDARDNNADMISKNRQYYPEGHLSSNAKLKKEDVIKIRELIKKGNVPQHKIGKMFNVSQQTISRIKENKAWRNI